MTISDLNSIISTALAVGTAVVLGLYVVYGRRPSRKFFISASVIMALLVVSYLGLLAYVSHTTVVSVNGGTRVSSLVNPPPTETPSPTPTSPIQQVVPINQTMTCTDCSPSGYNFSLIVRDATIDPAKQQVTLLVGVQNNTADTFSPYINFLKLQDTQTGITTSGEGDGFSNFQITAKQLILFRPTFQFVPVAGHLYSLSGNLSSEFDLSPITIKF